LVFTALISAGSFAVDSGSSQNYAIGHAVIDGGGGSANSDNYAVLGKTRDKSINRPSNPISAAYQLWEGFLYGVLLCDRTKPGTIVDLAASTGQNNGEVNLTWTAVGDDGYVGTASSYIVKYSDSPITNQNEFDNASSYVQNWTPLSAGSTESKVLTGLTPGDELYFCIEAADECGKQGEVSNSPKVVVKAPDDSEPQIIGPIEHDPKIFDPGKGPLSISYTLNKDAIISVFIFNKAGELIWKRTFTAGTPGGQVGDNTVVWNGISDFLQTAHNGVYVYHIVSRQGGEVRSMGRGKFVVYR
jgi:hypothetical protein